MSKFSEERTKYVVCMVHDRIWDLADPCPCAEFPLSSCRMIHFEASADFLESVIEPAGGVS